MNSAALRSELARLREELDRRRGTRIQYAPQQPTARQKQFLECTAFEALYGGSAGGGKSSALLMAALQYVPVPGYAALILRRTYADLALPGAIMDRAKAWLVPQGVTWNEQNKRFTFPSNATLTFGYLDSDKDRFRYQGSELQFLGVDEATQLPEQWYLYLLSRLRRCKGHDVPIRARLASNPGGVGHEWVKRRFVDDATRGDRVFVPAGLRDNPYVDADAYESALAQLDPTTRRQLLDGIWVRDSEGLVYQHTEANLIDEAPKLTNFVLGIDYGFRDPTAFTVLGWRDNDPVTYILRSYKRHGLTPSDAAEEVRSLEQDYEGGFQRIVGDEGGLGKGYAEEARQRFHLPIEAAEKNNKRGYISLFNGALFHQQIKVVRGACDELIGEWHELPWDEAKNAEASSFANHCADSALYGWRACLSFTEEPKEQPPVYGSPQWYASQEQAITEQLEREVEEERANDWARDMFG